MRKFLILFSFLFATNLVAQEEEIPAKKSGIQIRAIAFNLFENIDAVELRREEQILTQLQLPTDQLRISVPVSARQFTCGVAEEKGFRVLGNVILPEIGRNFILVFVPTKTGYRIFPVRSDDPAFKGNDILLFNFTKSTIGVMLGTAKQKIMPLKSAQMSPGIAPEDTFYQALFTYQKDEKGGPFIPFNNTNWPVNSNTKHMVFVHQDITTGEFTYRAVTELAAP
jgi:hypothetical protein